MLQLELFFHFRNQMDGSIQVSRAFCKCNICKQPFNDIKSLETHILHVHKFKQLNGAPVTKILKREVKAKVKCSLCKKEFNRYKILQGHIRRIHGKFICTKCHKVFSENDQLKDHLQSHKNNVKIGLIPHLPNQ